MALSSIVPCWVVRQNGTIAAVYRTRRRAAAHGGDVTRSVLVPATLWDAMHRFADCWFRYRDTRALTLLDQVTWEQVMDAEAQAHLQLARHGVRVVAVTTPLHANQSATEAYTAAVHERDAARELVAQLQAENRTLRQEIRELEREPQDTQTAVVMDITRTIGYLNAAMNAPADAVQAYRTGMLYAAQVLTSSTRPKVASVKGVVQ